MHPRTGTRGIQFLTTAITSTPHALATRLLADGVPMHVPARASVTRDAEGAIEVDIDPGRGSAPDARATLAPATTPLLSPPWNECFADWRAFLAYCVPQDRAMGVLPGGRVLRQEIELGIPLESCRPLAGMVESKGARAIAGDAAALCFLVERVAFKFAGQGVDS